jgi:predicted ArsR family transcriptional regulator
LAILKALGDNTRYAVYLELARAASPRSTADIAATLELHPNTVRPHLERMRDVGLLTVTTEVTGGVGRPQHLYSLAPDAPSLGLEPASFPVLARVLLNLAAATGAGADEARAAGEAQGRDDARALGRRSSCLDGVAKQMATLGFDPAVVTDEDLATVAFTHCPFRELAEIHPDLICSLHLGVVDGIVGELGGAEVESFRSLVDRDPCQVDIRTTHPRSEDPVPAGRG